MKIQPLPEPLYEIFQSSIFLTFSRKCEKLRSSLSGSPYDKDNINVKSFNYLETGNTKVKKNYRVTPNSSDDFQR